MMFDFVLCFVLEYLQKHYCITRKVRGLSLKMLSHNIFQNVYTTKKKKKWDVLDFSHSKELEQTLFVSLALEIC